MSLPFPYPKPARILYTFSVIIVALFVMGFLFTVLYAVIVPLRAAITSTMSQYDVANSTYTNFELADVFMNNLWVYLLVFVVLVLLYWVYHYSQRKGIPVVYS